MNLLRKDDISPMQENVVLSEARASLPPSPLLSPSFFVSSVIA